MKPEVFLLENADWPALLVEEAGVIRRANQSAILAFGSVVENDSALLGAIWSAENELPAEQFLGKSERGSFSLAFRVKGGGSTRYRTVVCPITREERKYFVFQLLKESEHAAPVTSEGAPLDASLVHKQKLDCALQLARSVALDFNNALTSVLGHTSLLLSKIEAKSPWRSSLVEIEKSAAKAAEIAHDLAAFSRQEKDSRAPLGTNLNTVVERTVDLFRTPELTAIKWTLQLEKRLFAASFDEAKISQAFVKLMENAVQSIQGTGEITIRTRNLELAEPSQDRNVKLAAGNYVCVEFADSGVGIPAEILPRIFEPFFTTKGAKHRGLGLAWVYGIVTNHGGGVAVSSEPSAGTSVRVYLPASRKIVRNAATPADLTGKETILMVDDEDLLLTMGDMVLSSFGYTVITANSGQKALDIISKTPDAVDLLITDLVMPQMSGRELIDTVRRISPHLRIITSSGYVRNTSSDAEAYLQKPFTHLELLQIVKQVLSRDD